MISPVRFSAVCPSDEFGRPNMIPAQDGEFVAWESYKALADKLAAFESLAATETAFGRFALVEETRFGASVIRGISKGTELLGPAQIVTEHNALVDFLAGAKGALAASADIAKQLEDARETIQALEDRESAENLLRLAAEEREAKYRAALSEIANHQNADIYEAQPLAEIARRAGETTLLASRMKEDRPPFEERLKRLTDAHKGRFTEGLSSDEIARDIRDGGTGDGAELAEAVRQIYLLEFALGWAERIDDHQWDTTLEVEFPEELAEELVGCGLLERREGVVDESNIDTIDHVGGRDPKIGDKYFNFRLTKEAKSLSDAKKAAAKARAANLAH